MTSLPSFRRSPLLLQALTHRSFANEQPGEVADNERLEFLGDAVLKFIMGKLLYERYPDFQEGELSRLRASLENNRHQLAEFAQALGLDKILRLGKGAEKEGARQNPEILSNTFEAVVGAYFLDAGIEAAIAFVETLVIPVADRLVQQPTDRLGQNSKGELQEWALAHCGEIPKYKTLTESGADHAKTFTVAVSIQGQEWGRGTAASKKQAQKAAAAVALQKLTTSPATTNSPTGAAPEGDRFALLQALATQINPQQSP
ncbi:ribonuclease III [Synechococcus moorigangaii CMS01]|nr:ribonuclease III [Synechococcus moorigangaii CMS01]